ncbi:hypothetical protein ACLI1A_07045 [Flavobacterium sp. RHBU_3]|uniref:hypothetical protein n=1 Tax=Flavobacterium sp. RHBU_3 TaxID=3391184 RepID=UPI003984B401
MTANFFSKEENIFEDFKELITEEILNGKSIIINLEELQERLNSLENILQEKLFIEDKFWENTFYIYLNLTLSKFYDSFRIRKFDNDVLYFSFRKYIEFLIYLSNNTLKVKSTKEHLENFNNIISLSDFESKIDPYYEFELNPPKEYKSIKQFEESIGRRMGIEKNELSGVVYIKEDYNGILIYCNGYVAKRIIWNDNTFSFFVEESIFYISLQIIYYKNVKRVVSEDFSLSLYYILSAFKRIDGLTFEIEDLSKGSIISKLKLWLKDEKTKEQTIDLLKKGKDATIAYYIDSKLSNLEKERKEIEKLQEEVEILKRDKTQKLTNEQYQLKTSYELEKARLENEASRLSNLKASLEIADMAAELMKKGILCSKDVEMYINDNLYFRKEGNETNFSNVNVNNIT